MGAAPGAPSKPAAPGRPVAEGEPGRCATPAGVEGWPEMSAGMGTRSTACGDPPRRGARAAARRAPDAAAAPRAAAAPAAAPASRFAAVPVSSRRTVLWNSR